MIGVARDHRDEPAENAAIAATCRKEAAAPVHERCKCRGNPLAMNPLPLLARNPFIDSSVAEQNQRLPKAKPFCRGYLPDVPSPFVQNWAFAVHKVDLVNGAKKKNCPFACIELWEKVHLPMQSIHQQTCSMSSNMPEHNRDCIRHYVWELPLLRPHAVRVCNLP